MYIHVYVSGVLYELVYVQLLSDVLEEATGVFLVGYV